MAITGATSTRTKTIAYGIDSYTTGYNSTTGQDNVPGGSYQAQTAALIPSPYRRHLMRGVDLRKLSAVSWAATFEPDRPDILVLMAGINDLILDSVVLATLQSRASAVFTPALSAGCKVVYCDIAWCVFGSGDPRRGTAQSFNTWLDSQGLSGVCHYSSDSAFSDSSNATYWQTDATHPNGTGHGVIASYLAPILKPL